MSCIIDQLIDCIAAEVRQGLQENRDLLEKNQRARLGLRIHIDPVPEGKRIAARSTDNNGRRWFSLGRLVTNKKTLEETS